MILTRVPIILLTLLSFAAGKIYKRCELARELRNFDVAEIEIPTWVCIAQHESNFDTAAMNNGSGDHGLFQISELYWCSPPGNGYGCNSPCSKFRDDDIADDLQCIRRIYNEHKRISGDGFSAWVVYPLYCKGDNAKYIQGCYDGEPDNIIENEITTEEFGEYGDGYQFPALPSSFSSASNAEYGDGYEFPRLPSINHTMPTKNASTQRISKIIKHKFGKVPYSKTSIHNAVFVGTFSKQLPYSKVSIHHAVPVRTMTLLDFNAVKFPYSKESIHHFIPINGDSPKPTEEPVVENQHFATELNDENNEIISSSTAGELNDVRQFNCSSTEKTLPTTTVPTVSVSDHLTTTYNTKKYDLKTPFKTSTVKSNFLEKNGGKTKEKSSFLTKPPPTNKEKIGTLHYTPFKVSTFSQSTTYPSGNNFFPYDTRSRFTTIRTPVSSAKSWIPTKNYFVKGAPTNFTRSGVSIHSNTPKALQQRAYFDLEVASSTFSPQRQFYNSPFKTTIKSPAKSPTFIGLDSFSTSSTTPRYHLPKASTTISNKPFSYKTPITTTPSVFSRISTNKQQQHPRKTFRNYKHPTPSDIPSSTTTKPSERQVTFAPDSFFSWLFSSQTLPPLVAPARPQRPQGERPNFPRPGAPLGGTNVGLTQVPGQLQPTTTRRPFPLRPNAPSRPLRPPQSRPFGSATAAPRPPTYFSRKPLKPGAEHSVLVVFRGGATETPQHDGGRSTEASVGSSATGVTSTVSAARASEGEADEIKLDDHFVFVRTKYGYRLFRV